MKASGRRSMEGPRAHERNTLQQQHEGGGSTGSRALSPSAHTELLTRIETTGWARAAKSLEGNNCMILQIGGGDPSGPKTQLMGIDLMHFNDLESTAKEINNTYGIKPVTLDQCHNGIVDKHELMGGEHDIGDDSETCIVSHVSKKTHSQHVQPRWK